MILFLICRFSTGFLLIIFLVILQNRICSRDSWRILKFYFSSACSTISVFEKRRNEMPLAVVRDVIYSPIKSGFQKNDKRLRLKSPNTPEAKRRYLTPSGTRAGVFWWPLFYPLQWWAQVQFRTLLFREKVIANMNLFLLQRTNKFGKHHLHKVRDILNVKI